jgi:hypothetical protein
MNLEELIFNQCWAQLMDHQDDEHQQIYCDEKTQTLSFTDGTPYRERWAKDTLWRWIHDDLEEQGFVILYTCKDNAEISLDHIKDWTDEERAEFEELKETPELYQGKLHILYD